MGSTLGHSAGIIILVALAVIVGMKFMHEHSVAAQGGPTSQPNAVNPATAPSQYMKY